MSIFDFCGSWLEKHEGNSLEPLMRAMQVQESKIQESLNATATQRIWVKGSTLITAYNSEFGEVSTGFALNGGWRVSTRRENSKQMISRCSFESNKRILLIEKKLTRQGGILRDERRVERDEAGRVIMRQRLEFIPISESKSTSATNEQTASSTVVANRIWEKCSLGWIDTLLDRIRGVWVLDETSSDSLRPIFEAMNLPAGSIRSALAMRTQHTIFPSGPRELLLLNQSLHGDLKTATHPVRELASGEELKFPEKGKMVCYATSSDCISLLSTSEDGSSSNQDERTISQDGLYFTQRITFFQTGNDAVVVNRRWNRAPNHPQPWIDSLPSFRARTPKTPSRSIIVTPIPSASALPPVSTPRTTRSEVRDPPTSPTKTPAPYRKDKVTEPVRMLPLTSPPSPRRDANVSLMTAAPMVPSIASEGSNILLEASFKESLTNPFTSALLIIIACTAARFFVDDILVLAVGFPVYFLLRSSVRTVTENGNLPLITPWVNTSVLMLVATIALFFPSKGRDIVVGEDIEDKLFVFMAFCCWGISRFYAPSRTSYLLTAQDQWLSIAVTGVMVTLAIMYAFPKIVSGDDENEPGLGALMMLPLLGYGWLRVYAFQGPPPARANELANTAQIPMQVFEVGVEQHRISGSGKFAEYLVYVQVPNGQRYTAWQRYSAFRALRRELGRQDINIPGKILFGNQSSGVLDSRLGELDAFLKQIFKENGDEKFLETSHEVRLFIGAPPK